MAKIERFEDIKAWQKARELVKLYTVYPLPSQSSARILDYVTRSGARLYLL